MPACFILSSEVWKKVLSHLIRRNPSVPSILQFGNIALKLNCLLWQSYYCDPTVIAYFN